MKQSFLYYRAGLRAALALLVVWVAGCANPDLGTGPNQAVTEPERAHPTVTRDVQGGSGSFGIAISPPVLAKRAGPQKTAKIEKRILAKQAVTLLYSMDIRLPLSAFPEGR